MWREIIDDSQHSHTPTAPVDPDSLDALLSSAGTPEDLRGLLDDTDASSRATVRKRVTWAPALSSSVGYRAEAASSQARHAQGAPDWFDGAVSARMFDCPHGFVCFEEECDTTFTPVCSRAQCIADARAWQQQHVSGTSAAGAGSSS